MHFWDIGCNLLPLVACETLCFNLLRPFRDIGPLFARKKTSSGENRINHYKHMKTLLVKPLVLGCLGLAITSMLPSCVDARAGYRGPQASVSVGYEARTLPIGYRTEVIGGTSYYIHNGVYYRPRSGRYVVVEAPRPAYIRGSHRDVIITRLPSGYRTVTHRGVRYYQAGSVYYQQRGTGYVVVGRPY